jgi:formylglycine-generating enzyme required for sulfatase activity
MRGRITLVCGGLVCLAVGGLLWAGVPAQESTRGRKFAFLVGVKKYNHAKLRNLEFAENDVEELDGVLRAKGFKAVLVFTTRTAAKNEKFKPTARNILFRLQEFLRNANVGKNDLILVGLAGHGLQPLGSDESYYCPYDANPTMVAAQGDKPPVPAEPETLVPITQILKILDDSGVGEKLLLVDACRNDPEARGSRGVNHVSVAALPPQTGVLLSCSTGEFSFENKAWGKGGHGAFFYHVIEGLNGGAKDEDGAVTFESLATHVRKRVSRSVKLVYGAEGGEQRPNLISNLSGEPVALAISRLGPSTMQRARSMIPDLSPKLVTNSIGIKLALIPAGEFLMGRANAAAGANDSEKPQHRVRITNPFYLGVHEVTQEQFEHVMGTNPSWFSARGAGREKVSGQTTGRLPVENVSWYEVVEFCNKMSDRESRGPYYRLAKVVRNEDGSIKEARLSIERGNGYRLPTEAEWEYACRAGTTTPFHFGTSHNGIHANSNGNYPFGTTERGPDLERTTTVGSYNMANAFGLYDMHGNVWEWCGDWYDKDYYAKSPEMDPPGPSAGSDRVLRGGGWTSFAVYCRSANRYSVRPAFRRTNAGFRLACSR